MPDVLGGSYYGSEVYSDDAPGGAWDNFIGYDTYAPADGYLDTQAKLYDASGEIVQWGGGSDPYQSPRLSNSDILRSRDAGIVYPASPINTVPPVVGSGGSPSAWGGIFKTAVDVFGKAAVVLGGTLAAQALERSIPGRPGVNDTKPGAPAGLPARPFVLPSFLGGGTFSPTSSNLMIAVIVGGVALLLVALVARR